MAEPERGTYYGATQQGGNSGDVRTFPSVKTVMDAVAAGAGLSTVRDDDSFFASSEEEDGEEAASPDVGRAVAVARPLLQQYQVQYAELRRCLWRAQSAAVTATQDGRERSQLQLKTFANIEVGCAELERDLSASTRRLPEQDDEFTSGESTKKAAEEANALAARYRSLLEQKDRMRATLQVLSVSEQARATLRSGTPDMRRGRGAEEALKSIDSLRDMLRDFFGRGDDSSAAAPSRVAAELERVTRERLEWLTQRLRVGFATELANALREADPLGPEAGSWGSDSIVDGDAGGAGGGRGRAERAAEGSRDENRWRRAVARVKAAVNRLLHLQFGRSPRRNQSNATPEAGLQTASATDGLRLEVRATESFNMSGRGISAAAEGMEQPKVVIKEAGGTPAVWAGEAVWALDGLLEPVAVRFRFHFEEERPTNRTDRPEWFLSFLLRALAAYRPLLEDDGADANDSIVGGGVDRVAYFARGVALIARRRLRAQLGAAAADTALFSHTVEEALSFDRQLDQEANYAECPARFPGQSWPRCVEVFAQDEERFDRWMEADAAAVEAKLADAVAAPGTWQAVDWKNGPPSATPVTPSALALCRIFWEITGRYRPLRDPLKQLRFARRVQESLLRSYRNMLYWRGNECRLHTVFRDDGGDIDGITSTWAAALGAVLGSGKKEDTSPIGRWRSYCLAASSCAYVCTVLRDSEDDLLFAEMSEAAATASAAGTHVVGLGPPSASLSAVGAAVGGVSRAVTSVASSAETATAGVVRAVGGGAQTTIIGPTHAISAALTTLKGASRAARRVVRHASYSGTGATTTAGGAGGATPQTNPSEEPTSGEIGGVGGEGWNDLVDGMGREDEDMLGEGREGRAPLAAAMEVEGVAPAVRGGGDNGVADEAENGAGAASVEGSGVQEALFQEEAKRYGLMLDAMMQGAVAACRDGFLWHTRSYVRSWDRGLAVIVAASSLAVSSSAAAAPAAASVEASGKLAAGLELVSTAMGVAESALPSALFRELWTALAHELDVVMLNQIVQRRLEMTQDEGLQLRADLKALMGPFSLLARRRPEKHFPRLTEAVLLLSLEKSQLRSLSAGLDAHGGGVGEARRGSGWDGWREEGGKLSPEGIQMRDMLENVGVRRLGPAEASLLLDKRLRGDRREHLLRPSASAGDFNPPPSVSRRSPGDAVEPGQAGSSGTFPRPDGGGGVVNRSSREAVRSVG